MIIIKYIFIILVFFITFLIGYLISKRYSNRVAELKELQTGLNILETKIKFTYEPLQEIFLQMSQILNGNIGILFKKIAYSMEDKSTQKAVIKALSDTQTNLKEEDKKIIENLGKVLGKTDKDGQVSQIELTSTFLKSQIQKAEKEEEKNSKLYKTLGATVGLAFVIILI